MLSVFLVWEIFNDFFFIKKYKKKNFNRKEELIRIEEELKREFEDKRGKRDTRAVRNTYKWLLKKEDAKARAKGPDVEQLKDEAIVRIILIKIDYFNLISRICYLNFN